MPPILDASSSNKVQKEKTSKTKWRRTRDEQEVAGYLELLELVFQEYQNMNFSEGVILQLHDMMLKYTEKDVGHRGKYKF